MNQRYKQTELLQGEIRYNNTTHEKEEENIDKQEIRTYGKRVKGRTDKI